MMPEFAPSTCRICNNMCGILVETENGRLVSVTGDKDNPYSQGYTCLKGRAYPEFINHPDRLLTSMKRRADGSFEPISSEQALAEIATKLQELINSHGPNSVASYTGTLAAWTNPVTLSMATGFMQAIGSWMRFDPSTIDQPGRAIAQTIQGIWQAPFAGGAEADAIMLFGINSLVSYIGLPTGHIAKNLAEIQARGGKLIVIDPRRTELARRADLYLQPRPGTDTALVAAMIHVILAEGLEDREFLMDNAEGVEDLRRAVAIFDPESVASYAGLEAQEIIKAARIFARARRGYALSGTGPNMGQPGTLLAYLILNLDVLCGHFLRAGDRIANIGALAPRNQPVAQVLRVPVRDASRTMHSRGLASTILGPSLSSLPAQMVIQGEDRVRSLIVCGGNPAMAWPDQRRVMEGLEALDLLVTIDPFMSETAQMADYVIAPLMGLEQPSTSQVLDLTYTMGHGPARTYGIYTGAVTRPPAGSDLIADWEVYYGLAKRLRVPLSLPDLWGVLPPAPLDMADKPSPDDLLELASRNSFVPLTEIKRHPHGAHFPDVELDVAPRDAQNCEMLRLADSDMMEQLAMTAAQLGVSPPENYRLISRRMMHVMNSTYNQSRLKGRRSWNPAYLHSSDLKLLGLVNGDIVKIASSRASVLAVVEGDNTLRPGTVSLSHCFGGTDGKDNPLDTGANTSRLVDSMKDYDPYSGQPRMSNIPVTITPQKHFAADA